MQAVLALSRSRVRLHFKKWKKPGRARLFYLSESLFCVLGIVSFILSHTYGLCIYFALLLFRLRHILRHFSEKRLERYFLEGIPIYRFCFIILFPILLSFYLSDLYNHKPEALVETLMGIVYGYQGLLLWGDHGNQEPPDGGDAA